MGPVLSADWFWPWGSKGLAPWSVFGYFLLTKKVTSANRRFDRSINRMKPVAASKPKVFQRCNVADKRVAGLRPAIEKTPGNVLY